MIPVQQTKFGIEGNCLSASIASILEKDILDVPDYNELSKTYLSDEWPIVAQLSSIEKGFTLTAVYFDGCLDLARRISKKCVDTSGYFIVVGTTRDIDGMVHANVWNHEGFQFDPSLSGENRINNIEMAYVILKTNKTESTYTPYQNDLNLEQK